MAEFIKHGVIEGDTIQAIAQRYLGDVNKWVELVMINELEHPYIINNYRDENTPANVRAIGEVVLIPLSEERDLLSELKPYQIKQGLDNVLGEDIAVFSPSNTVSLLEGSGEVQGDNRGDLLTVKGIDNFKQALLIRFSIPMGSLYHHPQFGTRIYEYLGKKNSYENLQKLKIEIERTARDDARVKNVNISKFQLGRNDSVVVELEIEAIGIEEVVNMGLELDEGGIIEWD